MGEFCLRQGPEQQGSRGATASHLRQQVALTGCVRPVTLACHARRTLLQPDSVVPSPLLDATGQAWLMVRQRKSSYDVLLLASRFMRPEAVIILHIALVVPPQLPGRGKFVDIDQLSFQPPEPALDYDINCQPGLAVHTLEDVQVLCKRSINTRLASHPTI